MTYWPAIISSEAALGVMASTLSLHLEFCKTCHLLDVGGPVTKVLSLVDKNKEDKTRTKHQQF